ncbi:hypothetical protein [Bradyrhizobium diversitatis]|uniref:HEAT repeat domain-containing protein n=1 Tax=Bradyrhizobium diversitatis TaxID=2755406 RepID=A0ABS0PFJ9_9BRAD|nr:hypothetical protein [Bradyrhizobium diversitatis]MBH5392095.1 hypothetical protein [Bradyrhizobium diversitatis]
MARKPRRAPATAETAHVIDMMLESQNPEHVKAGLQRACEILEGGQAFLDYTFLNASLAAHLISPEIRIRRWSYKLVALLKDNRHLDQLEKALLGTETDAENRGWASAAFSGLADEVRKSNLIRRLSDYKGTSLELAAKLYARGEPARDELDLRAWEREPLARKWLCLLCGYAPDNPRTIDQRFGDLDLVRNSVSDSDVEVVEYSIWAEHRHPEGSFRHLLRRPDELLAFPNVRRWLYRLMTKDAVAARSNLDFLTEKMDASNETSEVAREGLALGLASLELHERRVETIDWFESEPSLRVRLALVDHLGLLANQHHDAIARDVLIAAYIRCDPLDLVGAKILSVARPEWGLAKTRLVMPDQQHAASMRDLFQSPSGPVINVNKVEIDMSTKITQSGTGNSMAGVAGRDIVASTVKALQQQADQSFKELTPLIEAFMRALATSKIAEGEKAAAVRAVEDTANASGEEKKSRLQTLKSVVRGMLALPGMAADAIEGGEKLVEAIQHAVGG